MATGDKCVIIGAGVAGLWTAWALRRRGMEVTVVDRSTTASGASWGNAGWICPAQTGPLPEPGVISHGLLNMTKRDSSLSFTLPAIARLAPWLAQFASYSNSADYYRGVDALSPLGFESFRLIAELGLDEHFDKSGLLTVSRRREDIQQFLEKIAPLSVFGQDVPGELLTGSSVQDVEPIVPQGHYAVLTGNHWQAIPTVLNKAVVDMVTREGVRIREHESVTGFEFDRGLVTAVRTDKTTLPADHVVIAAGTATASLTRRLGHPLPIVGGKGYSFDVRSTRMPRRAIQALDTHVAFAPMQGRIRVVGGMDFSNSPERIIDRRVDALRRSAAAYIGPWEDVSGPWTGQRPMAPDGLPVLGRLSPDTNVFAATGYSMLGMTISPAAGVHLAEAIVSGDDGATGPFSARRFDGWARRLVRRAS